MIKQSHKQMKENEFIFLNFKEAIYSIWLRILYKLNTDYRIQSYANLREI